MQQRTPNKHPAEKKQNKYRHTNKTEMHKSTKYHLHETFFILPVFGWVLSKRS